jgi:hypothetical protein
MRFTSVRHASTLLTTHVGFSEDALFTRFDSPASSQIFFYRAQYRAPSIQAHALGGGPSGGWGKPPLNLTPLEIREHAPQTKSGNSRARSRALRHHCAVAAASPSPQSPSPPHRRVAIVPPSPSLPPPSPLPHSPRCAYIARGGRATAASRSGQALSRCGT